MNEIVYQAIIPMNPITKKNSQKIITNRKTGKPMIVQSAAYSQYEKDCGYFLKRVKQPIDYPIMIEYQFYRKNAIRCDISNLIAAVDDILVHWSIIKDDNYKIIIGHDGSRFHIDKTNPRTEITIRRYYGEPDDQ